MSFFKRVPALICKIWYLIPRTVSEDDASRQQCKIWYLISPRFALAGFFFPSVLGVGSVSALFLAGSGKMAREEHAEICYRSRRSREEHRLEEECHACCH